ncbi:glycosyltransferase [Variovorax guangxiensis]|uniref:Glycosyltransferase n=1 Tax=Variovorax guangxiensis TaxID=1775474 RepID=A0A502DX04_9BURK|nr:glycosyltransferase [Variovorax guangxiensis]TPG24546.1 glycosyltransferase [Variovorax ginsengisoli]TPG28796.1 glycosyltransferase [Variovorax guangxiensis]
MRGSRPSSLAILLICFNHAKYIQRALDSITAQLFGGEIEVIVADDGSTDETVDIIARWAQLNPRFRYSQLARQPNMGITRNYARGFAACLQHDYVAVLEGDDYWIHPRKLALQVEFLEEHLECNLCSANYYVFKEDEESLSARVPVGGGYSLLDVRSLIADNVVGNFSTCVYRREVLQTLNPRLFELKAYDWIINICAARGSFIGFLNTPMSIYRLHGGGAWSATTTRKKLEDQRDALEDYDRITDGIYCADFLLLRERLDRSIEHLGENDKLLIGDLATKVALGRDFKSRPRHLLNLCPPIVLIVARLLVPPAVVQQLKKLWHRTK